MDPRPVMDQWPFIASQLAHNEEHLSPFKQLNTKSMYYKLFWHLLYKNSFYAFSGENYDISR